MTTYNTDLIDSLSGIGFDEHQALVYLTILELGPSSVWDIAKKSDLKRPTCYLVLDTLVWKGYASKTDDGKRTIYSVISPKQVLNRIEHRQKKFSEKITQLEALASATPQKPIIRLFEGEEGIKQAYNLSLEEPSNSEMTIYGTASVEQLMPEFISEYLHQRTARKINVRAILPDTPENRTVTSRNLTELRQTRFLPRDKFNPNLEINQFGNTIVYIAHSESNPFATVLENASLAKVEKERFNLIWEIANL